MLMPLYISGPHYFYKETPFESMILLFKLTLKMNWNSTTMIKFSFAYSS